ncbi:MAG TPA: type II toxin-antitoxin system VapC family toxin [Syntrophorhabdaceae bacterium]|nr:type II toxin-antitoxin system VapC family toxin [Syntrophorhabdaceae bacterium]
MRLILDTHVFLWWIVDSPQPSSRVRDVMRNPVNELFLSVASAWEIVIKVNLGRLRLPDRPDRFIPGQLMKNAIEPLPVEMSHALYVSRLPAIHRDPFDRTIIAQSILEKMPVVTRDADIAKYKTKTLW